MSKGTAHITEDIRLHSDSPRHLQMLCGVQDHHLRMLEERFGVALHLRGGHMSVQGAAHPVATVSAIVQRLASLVESGPTVTDDDVGQALQVLLQDPTVNVRALQNSPIHIPTRKKPIAPRTPGQRAYVESIRAADLVFGIGPAGTGKTYLAMAMAVESLLRQQYERIILCRPAVEAGEKLGFLPGSMQEKVNPYLRPLYDALHDMMDVEQARRLIDDGAIEVAPLAFMRGRTLAHSFVILDEGQNCTAEQMKMFLTRLGQGSKIVVTGDITQIDLPGAMASGLVQAVRVLRDVSTIRIHYLSDLDVVRHPLVQSIIRAYEANGSMV